MTVGNFLDCWNRYPWKCKVYQFEYNDDDILLDEFERTSKDPVWSVLDALQVYVDKEIFTFDIVNTDELVLILPPEKA